MKSKAASIDEYLAQLPPERRAAIEVLREVIRKNLPEGYEEVLQYGIIGYVVPLKAFPAGYLNRKNEPLPYVCLASQKNYMTIHLMSVYGPGEAEFRKSYEATGKRLDMGKACVRFRKVEDLALDVIAKTIARYPVAKWIEICTAAR